MTKAKASTDSQEKIHRKGRETEEGGVYLSTSFSSLPEGVYDAFSDVAKSRNVWPRDLFNEAILYLISQRRMGVPIVYVATTVGGEKKALWLSEEACHGIEEVAKEDKVNKNSLFLTSLKMYAKKEGLHVKF